MSGLHSGAAARILELPALLGRFGREHRQGRLVFTNGVFDLLHRGHAAYLEEARSLGDALVVGVNSDASARRLGKGADRPIVAEADRAFLVASLAVVDAAILFDEDTPERLIQALLPDVLVKGGDYRASEVAGGPSVLAVGGKIEIIPFVPGYSTTSLAERIRQPNLRPSGA